MSVMCLVNKNGTFHHKKDTFHPFQKLGGGEWAGGGAGVPIISKCVLA